MTTTPKIIGAIALTALLGAPGAMAEEETLEFRLLTTQVENTGFKVPQAQERSFNASRYVGVAMFDDGRTAFKQFVLIMDNQSSRGDYLGYSTYTFHDGDTLMLKFTAGWGDGPNRGEYEVLGGTGAYEGATGTGSFEAVDDPWDSANLFDVSITVQTPDGN